MIILTAKGNRDVGIENSRPATLTAKSQRIIDNARAAMESVLVVKIAEKEESEWQT
jgi:hypothetical protein